MKRKRLRYDLYNDYYVVLGIPAFASADDIQRAYRQRAKEVHPDRNPENVTWATEQFRRLNDAYDVLGNSQLRAEYDQLRWRYHPTERRTQTNPDPSGAPTSEAFFSANYAASFTSNVSFANRKRKNGSDLRFWFGDFSAFLKGPYRYVVAILFLVFFANLIFIATAQKQFGSGGQKQTYQVGALSGSLFIAVTRPPQTPLPTMQPTCANSNVTITEPHADAEINFESFDISGSAIDDRFAYYSLVIEALDANVPISYVLQVPLQQPVKNGVLVRGASIKNVSEGRYVLRLIVTRRDKTTLPPCEVVIRRKR